MEHARHPWKYVLWRNRETLEFDAQNSRRRQNSPDGQIWPGSLSQDCQCQIGRGSKIGTQNGTLPNGDRTAKKTSWRDGFRPGIDRRRPHAFARPYGHTSMVAAGSPTKFLHVPAKTVLAFGSKTVLGKTTCFPRRIWDNWVLRRFLCRTWVDLLVRCCVRSGWLR